MEVPLINSPLKALVDEEDYDLVIQFNWRLTDTKYVSACCSSIFGPSPIKLHRFILNFPLYRVDHKNRNSLDCRKDNLRKATKSQNMWNRRKSKNNTTGFKGVYFYAKRNSCSAYHAQITVLGTTKSLGCYPIARLAALAYDEAARFYFGKFACLNFP